jgi:hypothetical protein
MNVSFDYLTDEQRQALSAEDFGDPRRRLFPVLTEEDVKAAPYRIIVLPNKDEVKARIIAIATKKGFNLPEEWKVTEEKVEEKSATASTGFSSSEDTFAEFELDPTAAKDTSDGEYVLRTGKIFEAGQYKDKDFEISPEELCEAIAQFKPVELDVEHMPSIFDGKLGTLQAVALAEDGKSLIGTVKFPKWLDKVLSTVEKKVSATWDRTTKRLTKLALVRNPRVKDAAIYAAFMTNEFADDLEGATETEFTQILEQLMEEHFGKKTWDGMAMMQGIHDMAARGGAICDEKNMRSFSDRADFIAASEAKVMQQIHDASTRGGAKCDFVRERSGSTASSEYDNKGEKTMTLEDVKNFFKSMPEDANEVETKTELSAEEIAVKIKEAATLAAQDAVTAARVKWEEEAALKAEEEAKAKAGTEATTEETTEVENSSNEPSEREKELENEIAALRSKEVERDAEKFADEEIRAERAYPAERPAMIALFKQAFLDDNTSEAKVSFKQGETEVTASRVEAIKALYSVRKPHNLSYEEVEDFSANVLTTNFDNGEDYLGEAEQQAKAYAAKRKASGKASY